jgi:hypothetical protein
MVIFHSSLLTIPFSLAHLAPTTELQHHQDGSGLMKSINSRRKYHVRRYVPGYFKTQKNSHRRFTDLNQKRFILLTLISSKFEVLTIPITGPSATPDLDRPSLPSLDPDAGDDDVTWLNVTENDEVRKVIDVCVERWRSAGPEARKKMFALFAISGIFLAVCHHGHLLAICDMIRSGEL